jgi:hypothetical protein
MEHVLERDDDLTFVLSALRYQQAQINVTARGAQASV